MLDARKTDRRSLAYTLAVAIILVTSLTSLSGIALANHGDRTFTPNPAGPPPATSGGGVEPETATRGVGGTHTLTATVTEPADAESGPIGVDFENQEGDNDPDAGDTPETPDYTCSILVGQASCAILLTATVTGSDSIKGWIDHDNVNSTFEGDPLEGANLGESETLDPGAGDECALGPLEPDCTDVVTVEWGPGAPATLDCDDTGSGPDKERETNPSASGESSNETYLCTTKDRFGNPTGDADPNQDDDQPVKIDGEVENRINDPDLVDGASYDTPDYTCDAETDTGQCTMTITQNENEADTAVICFWHGVASAGQALCSEEQTGEFQGGDSADEGNDLADQVEKTWETRSADAGGIDAEAETATAEEGSTHTITATVYDQFGEPFTGTTTVNFEFFQGSVTDEDGNTPAQPELSCTTDNSSTCSVNYTHTGNATVDRICAWTSEAPTMEGNNLRGRCDGEGLDDEDDVGTTFDPPEPPDDDVDVVERVSETEGSPHRVVVRPARTRANPNSTQSVTATVLDREGQPIAGAEVIWDETGDGRFVERENETDSTGKATARVTSDTQGTQSVTARTTNCTARGSCKDGAFVFWSDRRCDEYGTSGPDRLVGRGGRDILCGFGGNDVIVGKGGRDRLHGGSGHDRIIGGKGKDLVRGEQGRDLLRGGPGADVLVGATGADTLRAGPGNDHLDGGFNPDRLFGGPGRDRCRESKGKDTERSCEVRIRRRG